MAPLIADNCTTSYLATSDEESGREAHKVRMRRDALPTPVGLTVLAVCSTCMALTKVDVSVFEMHIRALCPRCARTAGRRVHGVG